MHMKQEACQAMSVCQKNKSAELFQTANLGISVCSFILSVDMMPDAEELTALTCIPADLPIILHVIQLQYLTDPCADSSQTARMSTAPSFTQSIVNLASIVRIQVAYFIILQVVLSYYTNSYGNKNSPVSPERSSLAALKRKWK